MKVLKKDSKARVLKPYSVSKEVIQPKPSQIAEVIFPSKTSVLKTLKKMAQRPPHSQERGLVHQEVPDMSLSSQSETFISKVKKIKKPQLNRKGVIIREIPTPVSPASKKRRARDLVNKIKKNQKKIEEFVN